MTFIVMDWVCRLGELSIQSWSMAPSRSLILQHRLKPAIPARNDIAHEAKAPWGARSATGFTLGHTVANKAEEDAVMAHAQLAGAIIIDPAHDAFRGGYTASFQDPDGHLWEVVWNQEMDTPE